MLHLLLTITSICAVASACADHDGTLIKREGSARDWAYESSFDWGRVNPGMLARCMSMS